MQKPRQSKKELTRNRILEAAGRCFRKKGFSGIGVDGLAGEAGVTSGAFYGHFSSKGSIFNDVMTAGLAELKSNIAMFQKKYGSKWWREFAAFYTSKKRTCDLSEGCALQTLTPEVGRFDDETKALFEKELVDVIELAGQHPQDQQAVDKTYVSLAMLIGGVTLARAVKSRKRSKAIADAVKNAVFAMHPETSE